VTRVRSAGANELTSETLQALARLAGFTISPSNMTSLSAALRDQLASIELLDRLDLTDVNPSLEFDPRWS